MSDAISRRRALGLGAAMAFTSPLWAKKPESAANKPLPLATIPRSEEFVLRSNSGRAYRIRISLPHDIEPDLPLMIRGAKTVPLYVLDGGESFGAVSSLARTMQWGGELPPCLTVAIGYEDEEKAEKLEYRRYDLTPTQHPALGGYDKSTPDSWGGSAQFRSFIVDTLRPVIEKQFDVDGPRSVLIGHSLGGLFTLDTLVQSPAAFGNYLAMSPSLWFDDELVLKQLENSLEKGVSYPGRVAVYVGDREERISEPKARMTSNVLELDRLVAAHRSSFSGVEVSVLPRTSHHTIIGPALTQGLQFLISPPERRAETF
jgi:predicted alpha/beta superfamily hydrolase